MPQPRSSLQRRKVSRFRHRWSIPRGQKNPVAALSHQDFRCPKIFDTVADSRWPPLPEPMLLMDIWNLFLLMPNSKATDFDICRSTSNQTEMPVFMLISANATAIWFMAPMQACV